MESNYSIGCFQWFLKSGIAQQEMLQYGDNQYPFKSVWRSRISPPAPPTAQAQVLLAQVLHGPASIFTGKQSTLCRDAFERPIGCPGCPALTLPKQKKKKKAKAGTDRGRSIRRVLNESAPVSSWASPTVLAVKYIADWEVLQFRIDTQPQ